MPRTNSWLCQYSICQLGRPYWFGTSGQIATENLYIEAVRGGGYYYTDYESQIGEKVHDCSGLIVGALTCDDVDGSPEYSSPVAHGSTSQYYYNCSKTSETMDDFPYIPGTLVFTTNGDAKSHVGIYVGNFIDRDGDKHSDAVVEAMGHNWGVTTSDIDSYRWDCWGQLECCEIDTVKGQEFDARNTSSVINGNSKITINTEVMKPFIATTIEQFNATIDYDKIKEARVSGMMFFGGQLYTAIGIKQDVYTNPHLPKLVQDCNDAGLPYALYINVRAKTEIEADEECRVLYYMVSKYLPKLGIWLSLHLGYDTELNNKIIEIYYRYFVKWGISARCGFYVTPMQLAMITWPQFQDRFYLWQIDPMEVSKVDDELLDPSMFEVPD